MRTKIDVEGSEGHGKIVVKVEAWGEDMLDALGQLEQSVIQFREQAIRETIKHAAKPKDPATTVADISQALKQRDAYTGRSPYFHPIPVKRTPDIATTVYQHTPERDDGE